MERTDRVPFTEALGAVYALYRAEISEAVATIWWNALQAYDLEAVKHAFGRHAVNPDTGQFIPKPADVVRMIEGSTVDTALAAWAKVDRAIGQVGTYATVVFDDPLIHRVISDMGGWPGLGQKSVEEWPFVGKEFQNRYRGFRVARATPAYPPKLTGILDQQNGRQYAEQSPVFIGDIHAAQVVFSGGITQPLLPTAQEKAA